MAQTEPARFFYGEKWSRREIKKREEAVVVVVEGGGTNEQEKTASELQPACQNM